MLAPVRVTPPTVLPVTLAEAKAHLRVDGDDEDALIGALVEAATAHFDGWSGVLGRCLISQEWRVSAKDWPAGGYMRLPFADVSEAVVQYSDASNVEQTVSASLYATLQDEQGAFLRFSDDFSFPVVYDDRDDAVRVTITAGYGADQADVPASIRAAILLMVGHLYRNREAVVTGPNMKLPLGVEALIAPHRRIGV